MDKYADKGVYGVCELDGKAMSELNFPKYTIMNNTKAAKAYIEKLAMLIPDLVTGMTFYIHLDNLVIRWTIVHCHDSSLCDYRTIYIQHREPSLFLEITNKLKKNKTISSEEVDLMRIWSARVLIDMSIATVEEGILYVYI